MKKHLFLLVFNFLLYIGVNAQAQDSFAIQNYGVIKGSVIDDSLNEPIGGAALIVKSTKLGCHADLMGRYIIDSISEGICTVYTRCLGYKRVEKIVDVTRGNSKEINFRLQWDTTGLLWCPIIDTLPPLVPRDRTSTIHHWYWQEIKKMPGIYNY